MVATSRDAGLTDFAGVDGIFDFKKHPQRGLGPNGAAVAAVKTLRRGLVQNGR